MAVCFRHCQYSVYHISIVCLTQIQIVCDAMRKKGCLQKMICPLSSQRTCLLSYQPGVYEEYVNYLTSNFGRHGHTTICTICKLEKVYCGDMAEWCATTYKVCYVLHPLECVMSVKGHMREKESAKHLEDSRLTKGKG